MKKDRPHNKTFTQLFVDSVSPPATGRTDWFDTVLPGFRLRVSAGGHKAFSVVARVNGKQRRLAIGTLALYPKVAQARDVARQMLQSIARGVDPTIKPEAPVTVTEAATRYIAYAKKNRSWQVSDGLLRNHVLPQWGKRDIKQISKSDVRKLLNDRMAVAPGAGVNRIYAAGRGMFNWARSQDLITVSPFEDVPAPFEETERDRVLTDDELRRVLKAADGLGTYQRGFVLLLALTGQRRTECARMAWADVDMQKAVWTIPAEKSKNALLHEVPLTDMAMSVLEALPRLKSQFVFPGARTIKNGVVVDVPIGGFGRVKAVLDKRLAQDGGPDMARFTFHDFRRTASTIMARLKVPRLTISLVLNHAEGGVTRIYDRYAYLDEKRAALEKLANHIERLVDPDAERDNVVKLAVR
jgi:integrase